jgi:hypothetical protein
MQESQEFLGRNAKMRTWMSPRSAPDRTAARGRCRATLAMGFMAMFKKKDPKDLVREWQSKMRTEMRGVDRQIRGALASRTSRRRGTFPRRRLRAVHGRRHDRTRAVEERATCCMRHEHDATTDSRPTDPDDGPSPDGPSPRPATTQTSSARRRVSRNPSRIALSATTCEACVFWRRRSSRPAGRSRAYTKTRRR